MSLTGYVTEMEDYGLPARIGWHRARKQSKSVGPEPGKHPDAGRPSGPRPEAMLRLSRVELLCEFCESRFSYADANENDCCPSCGEDKGIQWATE